MVTEKPNVLYVSNKPDDFSVFQAAFQLYYNIYTARTMAETINILKQYSITVIVSEQQLLDMSGIQFFEAIISEYPDPIRMLLADANDADLMIKAINNAHVFRYVAKPLNEEELKQSIDVGIKIFNVEKQNRKYIGQMHDESIKLERMLSLFRKYVPGYVMGDLFTKETDSLFNGESLKVTIFFVVINDFNKHIKDLGPQIALDYLNNYYSFISLCVKEQKGFVDKFMNSNILGIFGAPIPNLNNEKNAVFCALNIMEKLKEFNLVYGKKIGYETRLSIGIHSGDAVVGNIGSDKYIVYTAIGDTVNTAYRIVELAVNEEPNTILISDSIYHEIEPDFVTESCGTKDIRGKGLIPMYRVMSKKK